MELAQIVRETQTIAVVGASANPSRPSNDVYRYLRATGDYTLYPVNPTISDLDGDQAYASLADLPVVPDLVDVFRRTEELPGVLAEVLALPTRPKTLWLQEGLVDEQVAAEARAAGIAVVMDRCLKIEHARLR
ncbi:CoA-binding protein [[Mycobacterium] wendilense]|uniref:CoA-binding protein n=1 Tax=[Mycobacterium] wendilense TaxID=3064284 RepID=A0ABM9MJ49_9MYCO|nr:CoA-binding protein [Mycolicibacterium sp. MU0050]CAJ1586421.1 CoA-binding protein [Mycolicibacterium sp. MU0050]